MHDIRTHLANLEAKGLLRRIDRAIDKNTELMPLVRWQFRGLDGADRTAWHFTNVTDAKGATYAGTVAVGVYAATLEIYAAALGVEVDQIPARWAEAQSVPIAPVVVDSGPVHDTVHTGSDVVAHGGVEEFAVPVSTPGLDAAPFTTDSGLVTRDPETGWMNMGIYRGHIKGPDRIGVNMGPRTHGWRHWDLARREGERLEAAFVIGAPPAVTFVSGARVAYGIEEYAVAGALVGEAVELVKCKTVELYVPASAEIVIEGYFDTDYVEPEGPFGEYTGYMGPRVYNPVLTVTGITHRRDPISCALMSQMPPSESSSLKAAAQSSNYLHHLRNECNIPQAKDIHFPEIAMDHWCVVQLAPCNPSIVWQALHAVLGRNSMVGKYVIAVDDDIDIRDMESVMWAMCFRVQPEQDIRLLGNRSIGLDPSGHPPTGGTEDNTVQTSFGSTCLINATRSFAYPPVALPTREHMEHARAIWEELGLPPLTPRVPWYGYELGDWSERDRTEAERALKGDHYVTGDDLAAERRPVGRERRD
jgi:4-hydroxy-3-polyprenylbenzoate decarboxylase